MSNLFPSLHRTCANRQLILRLGLCGAMTIVSAQALGHEDLDLGVKEIKFDLTCRPIVVIKNTGERPLPATFYMAVNPAYITLGKGHAQVQTSKSLRALDRHKKLLPVGGELEVPFSPQIDSATEPYIAQILVQGEFWEYNQKNDQLIATNDCMVGVGVIPVATSVPQVADLALAPIQASGASCKVRVKIINANHGPLPAQAWAGTEGIVVSIYDMDRQMRLAPLALSAIDSKHALVDGSVEFDDIRSPGAYRYSLWQVAGDPDFNNNHQEINLNNCTAETTK
ncbi:MAG: hypothetical protein U1F46_05935 [Marinagarivorans sp.]